MREKSLKIAGICVIYVLLILIQIGAFTPYKITETYFSSQNVPHTLIVERGYDNIFDIGYSHRDVRGGIKCLEIESIDYPFLILQFSATTIITLLLYYILVYKSANKINNKNELKEQNLQLQNTIDGLIRENTELIKNQKLYESLFSQKNKSNKTQGFSDIPKLDINSLAFADDETQKKAQEQYAQDILNYIESKIQ